MSTNSDFGSLKRSRWFRACLTLALTAGTASADLVNSIPGGTVISMPAIDYFGPGPQLFGPGMGVTWSSTNAANGGGSAFGYTGGYDYLDNGFWDGALGPMAGLNDSFDFSGVSDTMTFSFATPVGAVGGFLNYVPFASTPTTIAVYDSMGKLIESDNLTFLTSGNVDTGMFLGFQETTADISSFTLTDNYIGITNLTTGPPAAVPEPATLWLLAGSLGVLGLGLLRRKVRFSPSKVCVANRNGNRDSQQRHFGC